MNEVEVLTRRCVGLLQASKAVSKARAFAVSNDSVAVTSSAIASNLRLGWR